MEEQQSEGRGPVLFSGGSGGSLSFGGEEKEVVDLTRQCRWYMYISVERGPLPSPVSISPCIPRSCLLGLLKLGVLIFRISETLPRLTGHLGRLLPDLAKQYVPDLRVKRVQSLYTCALSHPPVTVKNHYEWPFPRRHAGACGSR